MSEAVRLQYVASRTMPWTSVIDDQTRRVPLPHRARAVTANIARVSSGRRRESEIVGFIKI